MKQSVLGTLMTVLFSVTAWADCPQVIGRSGGTPRAIAFDGIHSFAAVGRHVEIVDWTDPDHPKLLSTIESVDAVVDVSVDGTRLYVSTDRSGFEIVDIANPAMPRTLGVVQTEQACGSIGASGSTACAFAGYTYQFFDVSDPSNVRKTAQFAPDSEDVCVSPLVVLAGVAYVSSGFRGTQSIDSTHEGRPLASWFRGFGPIAVLSPGIVAVAKGVGMPYDDPPPLRIAILQTDDRIAPNTTEIGSFSLTDFVPTVMTRSEAGLLALDSSGDLHVFDISTLAAPLEIGRIHSGDHTDRIASAGRGALVYDSAVGLRYIDLHDPTAPQLRGSWSMWGGVRDALVRAGIGYIVDGSGTLRTLDVTNPVAPRLVASVTLNGPAWTMAVDGDFAYVGWVADEISNGPPWGIDTINIADPLHPTLIGSYQPDPGEKPLALAAGSHQVFAIIPPYPVQGSNGNLRVFDSHDPAHLTALGDMMLPEGAQALSLDHGVLYAASDVPNASLLAFDASGPGLPRQIGSTPINMRSPERITIADGFAYLGYQWMLQIVDIRDPAHMASLGSTVTRGTGAYRIGGGPWGDVGTVAVGNGRALLNGRHLIDVTNQNHPVWLHSFNCIDDATASAYVDGQFLIFADGMSVLRDDFAPTVSIPTQPLDARVCPWSPTTFKAEAAGLGGFTYYWQTYLDDEATWDRWFGWVFGGTDPDGFMFTIDRTPPYAADTQFRCLVGDSCSLVASHSARIVMTPTDVNCSGRTDARDVFAFVSLWLNGLPDADYNASLSVTIQDLFDFLSAWFMAAKR